MSGVVCKCVCDCKKNESFYCNDKCVPRSFFGIGARLCSPKDCPYYDPRPKPKGGPPGVKR